MQPLAELQQGYIGHGPPSFAAPSPIIAGPWAEEMPISCNLAYPARPKICCKLRHCMQQHRTEAVIQAELLSIHMISGKEHMILFVVYPVKNV